ncbi:MAG TPA: GAF domain-containing protein [Candidatus Dormibacteraeota bacterium]|nr:GAF domain-containing protein [Candidatus Dormibacteraeota bacterium]
MAEDQGWGGKDAVETADPLDVRPRDALERVHAACLELARLNDPDVLAQGAVRLALTLTKSSVAFLGLLDDAGVYEQIYARSATGTREIPRQEAESLIASAASTSNPSIAAELLEAWGETIGTIGVSREQSYSNTERLAFALFASQVAASLQIARLRHRRQEMVDTLINLRADLQRTEKERLVSAERAESATRVERAHELSVQALLAVSVHARSGHDLTEFYRGLTESVARLVGASSVLFWEVDQEHMLCPIAGAYGVDDEMMRRFYPTEVGHSRDDIASRVVYQDLVFRADAGDGLAESARVLSFLGVSSAISVPWRAGDQRLGLVAAYNSTRPQGFSREDAWVLQKAALAAGLVWQLKLAESDLKETVDRLQTVDAARQMLLKTVSTAVDNERKRFANQLHDDALQKLTAAELQLQRMAGSDAPNHPALDQAKGLLGETEDALRRLLFEVRPPALESPGGLEESIRDRLGIFRSLTGVDPELQLDLPTELSYEFRSMVFRQLAEAITNIEKHAGATRVQVSLTGSGGAVHGVVIDDGRGFVVAERNNLPGHMGLLALRERALMAGGWYKIESQPGLGTRIEFWMPIAP